MTAQVPSRDPRRDTYIASGFVLASCVSLQFGAALAVQLFPSVGVWGMTTLRLLIAGVLMMIVVRPRMGAWTWKQWRSILLFAFSLAGMNGLFYAGIATVPLGPAVAIEFLGPLILTAVLSRHWREGLWIVLALGGMALFFVDGMTGGDTLDPLGVAFILGAAAFWALYILAGAKAGQRVQGAGGLSVAVLLGGVLVSPLGLPTAVPAIGADPSLLLLALPAALLASVIPYSLEFAAMRRLPKPVFGILLALEPVVAAAAGFLLLGQNITALGIGAVSMVVAASVGATLTARR